MEEATGQEMTKYEKNRNIRRILGNITNHIGKIEIADNQIICYVSNRKLQKYLKENNNILNFKGFNEFSKLHLEALYGIGKTIKYIISDYCFDDVTLSSVEDTVMKFNRCTFKGDLKFINVNSILFNECCLLAADDLLICNQEEKPINFVSFYRSMFIDIMERKSKSYDDFIIKANNIEIRECSLSARNIELNSIDTKIFSTFLTSDYDIDLISKNLNIIKAAITSDNNLFISSDSVDSENALFESYTIEMQNKKLDFNEFTNINVKDTYGFNYNGITLKRPLYKYLKNVTPEDYELLRQRAILANTLYKVNEKCNSNLEVKINAYTRKLVNNSISETLDE